MKGIYVLEIKVKKSFEEKIGALGKIRFFSGKYFYVGSALKGIEKRVERHLKKEKKIHWHIDYFLANQNSKIENVYCKETKNKKEECETAKKLAKKGKEVKKFGCSDCKCKSHLLEINEKIDFKKIGLRELKEIF